MQRDEIDILVDVIEHCRFPLREGRHRRVGTTAGDELDRGIDPPHGDRRLTGEPPVLLGRFVTQLPEGVHLVAQTPRFHPMRFGHPVRPPQIAPQTVARMVAILDQRPRLVDAAGAQIDRQIDLGPGPFRPGGELIGPDRVRLR